MCLQHIYRHSLETVHSSYVTLPRLCTDLLPDDSERDWPAHELPGHRPWLLVGRHVGAKAQGGHRRDLAQVLPVSGDFHHLPVHPVRGHPPCSLHR